MPTLPGFIPFVPRRRPMRPTVAAGVTYTKERPTDRKERRRRRNKVARASRKKNR